ncbi:MAG: tRNA (adenosine(37)-N6)-dimethylallyltransferase MiaA [bacterium]|nr:tRNA (adenosine(37)-N6)-dimethylallyltransferase MiaA [bacterium]
MDELLVILGPTATGKSGLGMRLSRHLDGEIVNADALQVYRELDIGTDKPTTEERELVPHHLIDLKAPEERFSAGEFARAARAVISEVSSRGKSAILVGGSGLYLRALLEGINEIPEVPARVRSGLRQRLEVEGLAELRSELRRIDPITEARLASGDTQRVLRALEVAEATGTPLSAWLARELPKRPKIDARKVGLTLPRALLYDRIRSRVESMLDAGWVHEVESLLDRGYSGEEPAFQAIGYRQLVQHLRGGVSLGEAMEDTIRSTRRYAKRQLTWFRKDPAVAWFDASDPKRLDREVLAWLRS